MADLPVDLSNGLNELLTRVLDVEGKIPRAIQALGPVADRDVLLLDRTDGYRASQLRDLGARVSVNDGAQPAFGAADGSMDVVASFWSSFRGEAPTELAETERVLRPGGRLLVLHDYGRDDVSHLRGDQPEYGTWSRRGGPFLSAGFRVRVVHCFWTFESMEDCGAFLDAAFDAPGRTMASELKRPRLSYNVAIYHRSFGEPTTSASAETAAAVG